MGDTMGTLGTYASENPGQLLGIAGQGMSAASGRPQYGRIGQLTGSMADVATAKPGADTTAAMDKGIGQMSEMNKEAEVARLMQQKQMAMRKAGATPNRLNLGAMTPPPMIQRGGGGGAPSYFGQTKLASSGLSPQVAAYRRFGSDVGA